MMLKGLVNTEQKYSDLANQSITVSTTPTVNCIDGISLGTTATSRLGQSIKVTSFYISGNMSINASATETFIRLLVAIDHQSNATQAAFTDVMTLADVFSPRLIGNARRFTVLVDKRFALSANGSENKQFRIYKKRAFHVTYNTGNVGNYTDIQTNCLTVFWVSNEATNKPTVNFMTRLRFVDN